MYYVHTIIGPGYVLRTTDHWILYVFACAWSVFSKLPVVVIILTFCFVAVLSLYLLYCFNVGRKLRYSTTFLVAGLLIDALILVVLIAVAGFLYSLRNMSSSTYLQIYYAPIDNFDRPWFESLFEEALDGFAFKFKVDLIASVFIFVTIVVINVCFIFYEIKNSITLSICTVLLKTSSVAAFCAANLFTFTFFMEISSILMLFIVLSGTSRKRFHAGYVYFFYSAMSGVFLLVCISFLVVDGRRVSVLELLTEDLGELAFSLPAMCLFLVVVSLLIKIPSGPLYHWLLKAHVEASTSGSIILASVLLKIPACALLRLLVSMNFKVNRHVLLFLLFCTIFTIVACTSQMYCESDVKRIVALSSVVHMSGVVLFIVSSTILDTTISSATVLALLVAHSFSSAALFSVAGAISARYHTRDFKEISGLLHTMPAISSIFLISVFFAGALPVALVFISEVYMIASLVLLGSVPVTAFLLFFYSLVFIRFLVIYGSMISGVAPLGISTADSSCFEYIAVGIFIVILFVQAVYSLELGSIFSVVAVRQLIAMPSSRDVFPMMPSWMRRVAFQRGRRWGMGRDGREIQRDFFFTFESKQMRRRRIVLYLLNALKFRDKLGFLGQLPYKTSPIKPNVAFSWETFLRLQSTRDNSMSYFRADIHKNPATLKRRLRTLKKFHDKISSMS